MSRPEACKAGSVAPTAVLEQLHPSQAGSGRHKCPVCAYRLGFEEGVRWARSSVADVRRGEAAAAVLT